MGSYLAHFGGSWGRSLQKWPKCKSEHHYGVLATFPSLGGSCWRLLGLSWGVLARSWGVLDDLGFNLGPSWQHVGTKMAKMSQDRRTWEENGWLKATRYGAIRCGTVGARGVWARVGGCLELELREDSRSCHARGQGPADIQGAARAKPPPCRTCSWKLKKAA